MKKLALGLFVVLLAGVAFVAVMTSEWGISRRIDQTLARADESLLTDGKLHVVLCGTAAALPDANRAGPCTAILVNGEFLLVDVGPAAWRNVDLLNLPTSKLSGILITHFHSDHIGEIGEAVTQSWIAGRRKPLDIYGPPGLARVVEGFRQAYAQDTEYRVVHHGEEYMPRIGSTSVAHEFRLPEGDAAVSVFQRNGLSVTAFSVEHAPVHPAVGYRIEYGGRVVVVSGDTIKSESVIKNASGADILIHEALARDMTDRASARARATDHPRFGKLASDVGDYHTTPVQAGEVAAAAGVKELVLTHIFPPLPNMIAKRMFMNGVSDAFRGKLVLGEDGMRFDLDVDTAPAGKDPG